MSGYFINDLLHCGRKHISRPGGPEMIRTERVREPVFHFVKEDQDIGLDFYSAGVKI